MDIKHNFFLEGFPKVNTEIKFNNYKLKSGSMVSQGCLRLRVYRKGGPGGGGVTVTAGAAETRSGVVTEEGWLADTTGLLVTDEGKIQMAFAGSTKGCGSTGIILDSCHSSSSRKDQPSS